VLWANWPGSRLPEGTCVDHVEARKGARVLERYSGIELVRSYRAAIS